MLIYVLSMRETLHFQDMCDSGVVGNARPCQGRDRGFEPRLSLFKSQELSFLAFFNLWRIIFIGAERSIETEQIQTRKSDQCVDDSGNPAHTAKDESYQVKVEEPDQTPVDSADYCKSQTETI